MTTFNVIEASDGVTIQLTDVGVEKATLLETFAGCAGGTCECSSDEYEKVESMQVNDLGDNITIDVHTKPGETIDTACIRDCMTYVQDKASAKNACC